ncbi:PREDICTED: elongator complex protein 6-like [Amphimedon queenslandica]|uniref:Elongator complex protein 6 n=1 Tax=Amphimedon queenslandica TaxID=400682 RepID=A0A1X7VBT0_AMPQE|nr:PREDICTED: elongator complex protein 6-like [Amphimedon queenslandica]|eukprot:XP_019849561.1 PREDICTED: elongator complex protein 6-like [Amphimedon queenslandica]
MDALLDRKDKDDFLGQFILISDDQSPSDYFLHYFISQSIKDDYTVCLVSVNQSFDHYAAVASKFSVNLRASCSCFKFVKISSYSTDTDVATQAKQTEVSGPLDSTDTMTDQSSFCCYVERSVQELYELIKKLITTSSAGKPSCLIIDDISVLLSIGISIKDLLIFVKYLINLLQTKALSSLILRTHHDDDVEDEEERLLLTYLTHQSHLHLHTNGLKTGYSRDVHGEVTVERRRPFLIQPQTHTMQYRNLDRSINIFSKGLSQV